MAGSVYKGGRLVGVLTAAIIIGCPTRPLQAAQYYFSAMGSDQIGNGSESKPWRSVSKFNTLDLEPGDSVFFRAGDVFNGSLMLDANDSGIDSSGNLIAPITIGSFGGSSTDRASFRSHPTSEALLAYNTAGLELRNLEFFNGGTYTSNSSSGLEFMLDESAGFGSGHFQHIRIDNVVSRGFHRSGLSMYAAGGAGYQDVEVTNSQFHDNQFAGVEISAGQWTELIHRDIRIDQVTAHGNSGFAGCQPHCGHGIVLGQVDGATIENSVAHSNGIAAGKGNVGIWTWQSNDVTIQRNSAYGNRSPNGSDGGGFDIDGGVTNSIVQYNVSENNAGAGYLLAEFSFAEPMGQNTFRYNLSVNDGVDNYGAFTIWGQDSTSIASSALFHNNTAIVDREIAPNSRGTVWFVNSNHDDIVFINNLFVALNGAAIIEGDALLDRAWFLNNAYWTDGAPVEIDGEEFDSIAQWAAASLQEMLNGEFVGLEADPQFAADGSYRLAFPSSLIDAGLPPTSAAWPDWFSGVGPVDLFGTSVPQGGSVDIGAAESARLPGDYNGDKMVDAADYVVWRKSIGQPGSGLIADGNGDGRIDGEDFGLWWSDFGRSAFRGAHIAADSSPLAVPEPPAALWVGMAIAAIYAGRLKRNLAEYRPTVPSIVRPSNYRIEAFRRMQRIDNDLTTPCWRTCS